MPERVNLAEEPGAALRPTECTEEGEEPDMTHNMERDPGAATGCQRVASDRLPTTLHRRRRKPGEVNTRGSSIQNHCRECMGFSPDDTGTLADAVRACTAPECWLWPWRNGPVDPAANGNEMG